MLFFRRLLGVMSLILAICLLLALISYSPNDPSWLHTSSTAVLNWMGAYGAYIADYTIQVIGYTWILVITFILNEGLQSLFNGGKSFFLWRLASLLIAIVALSIFFDSICQADGWQMFTHVTLPHGMGGALGHYWRNIFLADTINNVIFYISASTALLCTLLCLGITPKEYTKYAMYIYKVIKITCRMIFVTFSVIANIVAKKKSSNIGRTATKKHNNEHKRADFAVAQNNTNVKSRNRGECTPSIHQNEKDYLQHVVIEEVAPIPPVSLLQQPTKAKQTVSKSEIEQQTAQLTQVLSDFGIRGSIVAVYPGPVVILYELEPAAGTKSSRVISLADDIARSMRAVSARIGVIPGKDAIGIELPNKIREIVYLREMLETSLYKNTEHHLPLILGKNIGGAPVIVDLAKMPHLLVAGTTGSGKSVAINTMVLSLLYKYTQKDCRIIMIDPKMLELSVYDGIPHLLAPVVTDPKKAVFALKWAVNEMEARYKAMSILGIRNIRGYNQLIEEASLKKTQIERKVQVGFDHDSGQPIFEVASIKNEKLPYIVIIVDEMADLMLVAGKEIELYVQRLAQMARAAGIHIIMATQRPSVDVITGVIKANFPTRISFQVTSKIDSRTILGEQGAEQLLGMGDMLYVTPGGRIERIHGPFVHDAEVRDVVQFLKNHSATEYAEDFIAEIQNMTESSDKNGLLSRASREDQNIDMLYDKAVTIVLQERKATTSYLQRCLKIGYNRAAMLIERMEKEGVLSPPNHIGKREILKKYE